MKTRNTRRDLPCDLESTPELEEVVLVLEDEQEVDSEPPPGFEDLLYEELRDRQFFRSRRPNHDDQGKESTVPPQSPQS